jgi:phage N-6-adenine-methyltransferase
MSLVGFKAQNHAQQTTKRGAVDEVDDRGTDQEFFDATADRFGGFTLDVAAAPHNAKCADYFTREDDGLSRNWLTPDGDTARVWCNPPYSDLRAWVTKACEEWTNGHCDLIVMLLPANRVEQKWWQELVEPYRDGRNGHRFMSVEFLPGRMRFDRPGWTPGPKGDRPPFGCCLLILRALP